MRTTKYLLLTLKDTPADADVISHQLMVRAGMIRKLASGLYDWLPTGVRVLRKIENIIREEMENIGSIEVSLPIVQPADLWHESGRWEEYGPELLRFTDRGKRCFVLGPTHEELMTDLVRHVITSYKQLPINLFQIQKKFRDELRPRFGIMRSREFIMKDAYSFHASQESLQETYDLMYKAYNNIFTRIGLKFHSVLADTGFMGGSKSHEFQVLAQNGEDNIVFSTCSDFAANIEVVAASTPFGSRLTPTEELRLVNTPNVNTILELVIKFNLPIKKIVKTLIVHAKKYSGHILVALLVRGDHELNKVKAEKHSLIANPLKFASKEEIINTINITSNSLGPIDIQLPIIIDHSVAVMSDFVAGSNIDGQHYFGINWERDLPQPETFDLRNVVNGDPSPDNKGTLFIKRGIEVGHIFQIGTKYSQSMQVFIQNRKGHNQIVTMGCYGIGVTRIVAAAIEQNHDDRGILWSDAVAPFCVAILPINMYKSYRIKKVAEQLYDNLKAQNIDVILDDRQERPGVMFSDLELIGVPYIVVISDRNLDNNQVEYKSRRNNESIFILLENIVNFLTETLSKSTN
ncbi:Proline--tRNA ligase [Candidatus Hartigia pinicola]|nr:Proline--tRNA ligase [Candidatus Hartigia pinicola]